MASLLLEGGVTDDWTWNTIDKSSRIGFENEDPITAVWWGGHSAIRGTRKLNGGLFYWEIEIHEAYAKPCMIGIGTHNAPLEATADVNFLLGMTSDSWGLSFTDLESTWESGNRPRAVVVHNGKSKAYPNARKVFGQKAIVGLFFDGIAGTLSYYQDGKCLGVAFTGLHLIQEPLYPMASSRSFGCLCGGVTKMTLLERTKSWPTLQHRCRAVIVNTIRSWDDVHQLELPSKLKDFIADSLQAGPGSAQETNDDDDKCTSQTLEKERKSFLTKMALKSKRIFLSKSNKS